jgi:hypothetical protein
MLKVLLSHSILFYKKHTVYHQAILIHTENYVHILDSKMTCHLHHVDEKSEYRYLTEV